MYRILKIIKNSMYNLCVRKIPQIQISYEGYVNSHKEKHEKHRLKSWVLLLKLNVIYYVFRQIPKPIISNAEAGKVYTNGSEASLSYHKTPHEFAEELMKYDVISFDIFDTLIFRPFLNPADLFYIVGEKQRYLDFKRLRVYAENMVRKEKLISHHTHEVTIEDIYSYMEQHMGIDADYGIKAEFLTEMDLCYANPFMEKVFDILQQNGKTIIATSDMYFRKNMLEQLLLHCGYSGFEDIFVSCEYGCSKYSGELYQIVKDTFGSQKAYVHIGDNKISDIQKAKGSGFYAVYYQNVNEAGIDYRPTSMSPIVGSVFKGIVNAHLHNGLQLYNSEYEYGFVCGGLFVLGYCRFIHDYAEKNQIDKVLFLSRDGEILKRVYDLLYPDNNSEYVYWSRLIATKLTAQRFKLIFFEKFIHHKINSGNSLRDVLISMELYELFMSYKDIPLESHLTNTTAKLLEKKLNERFDEVLNVYDEQSQAAKKYYSEKLIGCKKACAVDIGWAGSGAVSLSWLVENHWEIPCKITGVVAGTNTPHNSSYDASEQLLQSGMLTSYIYSQAFNRDLMYSHNPNMGHNIYFEFLLSSCEGSAKGFYPSTNEINYEIKFREKETENQQTVELIHNGVLDFVTEYKKRFEKYPYLFDIPGGDAFAPFKLVSSNKDYIKMVFSNCTFQVNVGDNNKRIPTI